MPEKSLAEKMKLRPEHHAGVINPPAGYLKELEAPRTMKPSARLDDGPFDWLQIFVKSQAELKSLAPKLLAALKPVSMLWVSFPKGTSTIQTDLTRDKGWRPLEPLGLKWINLVSVNETWSAFALRPHRAGEKKQKSWIGTRE